MRSAKLVTVMTKNTSVSHIETYLKFAICICLSYHLISAPSPIQPSQQQPKQPKPDPRAEQWASENEWFGQDKIMTTAAFTLHNQLTQEEGFDVNTEEYYTAIDSRMRTEFPHKFQKPTAKKTGGVQVASAGNSASRNKQGRRTVKLTPSQVAIAKKLGVPLEEYAKHVKE